MGIFLLIIAGLVAWFFISAMNRAKTRMAYADQQMALREAAELDVKPNLKPSWIKVGDSQQDFLHGAIMLAERNGTPISFGRLYFTEEDKVDELLNYIGLLQRGGSSFTDQKVAATRFITERFERLPDAIQEHYQQSPTVAEKNMKPNWAGIRKMVTTFVADMSAIVEGRSIPPSFFVALTEDPAAISEMMHAMALVQFEGGSFEDQKEAAGQVVFDRWLVLPNEEREPYMQENFRRLMGDAYRPPAV